MQFIKKLTVLDDKEDIWHESSAYAPLAQVKQCNITLDDLIQYEERALPSYLIDDFELLKGKFYL